MALKVQKFVESKLRRAQYERDESVKQWVGWIQGFPGVYAQGSSLEHVRDQLAEILEDRVLLSVREGKPLAGFSLKKSSGKTYA